MFLAGAAVEREGGSAGYDESEKRYSAVIEDQTDLICRFKPDGTIVFVNYAYCRFHEKTAHRTDRDKFFLFHAGAGS